MVSVAEASSIIFANLFRPSIKTIPFQEAVNKVLAENIMADRDFPPFDRVSMDGIAIQHSSWVKGRRDFIVEGLQPAGVSRKSMVNEEHCFEVMTGAVLPENTDTVIRYEDIDIKNGIASITIDKIVKGQNIHGQGKDAPSRSVLLEPGVLLSPAEVALLAAVGKHTVQVFDFPPAAIVASGDELVEVEAMPQPHQIRRSNTYAIQAAMKVLGWEGTAFHLVDD